MDLMDNPKAGLTTSSTGPTEGTAANARSLSAIADSPSPHAPPINIRYLYIYKIYKDLRLHSLGTQVTQVAPSHLGECSEV